MLLRDPDDLKLYLAEVVEINDQDVRVWCYGTRYKRANTQPRRAIFKHVFTSKGGTVHVGKPAVVATAWTWDIPLSALDTYVVAQDLRLLDSGRLDAETAATILSLQPSKLRIF